MSQSADWEAIHQELSAAGAPFEWIEAEKRELVTNLLLDGWNQFPFDEEFQRAGVARIERCTPLWLGPTRTVRLTQNQRSMVILEDPEHPGLLFAALGPNLPPEFWPAAEASSVGLQRDLEAYVARPFRSTHEYTRRLRVYRGSFEDIGLESLQHLANVIAHGEQWTDGAATWRSGCLTDPWPAEPSSESMLQLRVISDQAAEEHGSRMPSISLRSLWSRSVLKLEEGRWGNVVFELMWDPAPLKLPHRFVGEFPEDMPVDLVASLLRGSTLTPDGLAKLRDEELTPFAAMVTCLLEPTEATTFELLRELMQSEDPELKNAGIGLAADCGARGLLYELGVTTGDAELKARLGELTKLHPPPPQAPDDDDEWDDDDDWGEEDDEDYGDEEDEL
ncbi:MAG: hypothetical protein H6716_16985 [Polyangiaceae bacterium]|nr:hypothetical protein [Polyangiaceae bacterium]